MASGKPTISGNKNKSNNKPETSSTQTYETQLVNGIVVAIKPADQEGIKLGNGEKLH